jgi:hypothetical protein
MTTIAIILFFGMASATCTAAMLIRKKIKIKLSLLLTAFLFGVTATSILIIGRTVLITEIGPVASRIVVLTAILVIAASAMLFSIASLICTIAILKRVKKLTTLSATLLTILFYGIAAAASIFILAIIDTILTSNVALDLYYAIFPEREYMRYSHHGMFALLVWGPFIGLITFNTIPILLSIIVNLISAEKSSDGV